MRRIEVAERRRRLAVRHCLTEAARAPDPAAVAARLVALHGTDPATVFLSVRARTEPRVTPPVIERSLYDRRDLVRMLAMRRTVFVVPNESVPVMQAAVTDRVAADQRARLVRQLRDLGGISDPDPWLAEVEKSVLDVFARRRVPLSAAELSAAEPRLKTTMLMAAGKPYQATANITSRVLLVLAAQGHIVRGRPHGSWLSQRYRWSRTEDWLPQSRPHEGSDRQARAELARRWLTGYGPAPLTDLKWWTGWTMTHVRQALADAGAVEADLAGQTGYLLRDDLDDTADPGPWVALLPALDPTVMGWADRTWFLGDCATALFDANGNVGPTVWVDGRVAGAWAQRKDGDIAIKLFEDIGSQARTAVEAEAGEVSRWLHPIRVTPRFRTPAERELSA